MKTKEEIAAKNRAFRLSHPNYQHEWNLAHPERRREICRLSKRRTRRENPIPSLEASKRYVRKARLNHSEVIKLKDDRHNAKRRELGFTPLNEPFYGSEGHHVDREHVVYIPKELHQSIKHNVHTGWNMDKINELARRYA